MPATVGSGRVSNAQLCSATVLLVGVLAIAYGWFHPSRVGLYAGLFVTAAGVLTWVVRTVANGRGEAEHSK
jgi:hypothetical protein